MSRYGLPLRERIADWIEGVWECKITRRHHVKFGTAPYCYRCGKRAA